MSCILVCTDFSPSSMNATRYAYEMAESTGSKIVLLHVTQLPINFSDAPLVFPDIEELYQISRSGLEKIIKDMLHIGKSNISAEIEICLGSVPEEINKLCLRLNPLCVIMGSDRERNVNNLWGSTILGTIKITNTPVVAVPMGVRFSKIKKIILATDYKKEIAITPNNKILNFLRGTQAVLYIVHVDPKNRTFDSSSQEEGLMFENIFSEIKHEYVFIDNSNVQEGLLKYAEENLIDLIIIRPRKHDILETVFLKSHSSEMLRDSKIPIMYVHN